LVSAVDFNYIDSKRNNTKSKTFCKKLPLAPRLQIAPKLPDWPIAPYPSQYQIPTQQNSHPLQHQIPFPTQQNPLQHQIPFPTQQNSYPLQHQIMSHIQPLPYPCVLQVDGEPRCNQGK